ncbi:MAG TPA: hypothetical protein PLU22_07645, partial [Polyangiaceae bacterium]|nr:hypothetical protein [Polyangiaceae bacterium]
MAKTTKKADDKSTKGTDRAEKPASSKGTGSEPPWANEREDEDADEDEDGDEDEDADEDEDGDDEDDEDGDDEDDED